MEVQDRRKEKIKCSVRWCQEQTIAIAQDASTRKQTLFSHFISLKYGRGHSLIALTYIFISLQVSLPFTLQLYIANTEHAQ